MSNKGLPQPIAWGVVDRTAVASVGEKAPNVDGCIVTPGSTGITEIALSPDTGLPADRYYIEVTALQAPDFGMTWGTTFNTVTNGRGFSVQSRKATGVDAGDLFNCDFGFTVYQRPAN